MSALILAALVVAALGYGAAAPDSRTLHVTRAVGGAVGGAVGEGAQVMTAGVRQRVRARWQREPTTRWWRWTRIGLRGAHGAALTLGRSVRAAVRAAPTGWRAGWETADRVERDRQILRAHRAYRRASKAGDGPAMARAADRLEDLGQARPTEPTEPDPTERRSERTDSPDPSGPGGTSGPTGPPKTGEHMADNSVRIEHTDLSSVWSLDAEARSALDALNIVAQQLGAVSEWITNLPDRYASVRWGTTAIGRAIGEVNDADGRATSREQIAIAEALTGLQQAIAATRSLTEEVSAQGATGDTAAFRPE